jgi:hypothetical protein
MQKKRLIIGLATAAWITFMALNLHAAEGIRQVPVHFKKGASQAAIQGHIKGRETIDYVLNARAGQTMTVNLKTSNPMAYFNVLPPGSGEAIFTGQVGGASFEGKLPKDGDYRIRVYLVRAAARRSESAKYTLTVKVTGAAAAGTGQEPLAKEQGKKEVASGGQRNRIYDEPGMAIRTEYPDTMKVEGTGSGEGTGFIFTFKPQGNPLDQAKVHIFLPRGAATAAAQEPFVTGPKGLLENNGWKKEGGTTDTGKFPSEWVRKVISFADPKNKGMVGKILLGEAGGQAVQVILYYPADRGEEFLASANLILGKLHFKADQLPLKRSL